MGKLGGITTNQQKINFGPLFISLAAFLWTTDAFVRSNLSGKLTSSQIVLIDHIIIMILISPLVIKYGPKLMEFSRNEWIAILVIGIGGSALATVALTEGYFMGDYPFQYVAVVTLLQQSQPIIAIGLAHLLLKEKLPKYFYPLAALAMLGVILLIFPYISAGTNSIQGLATIFTDFSSKTGLIAGLLGLTAAILWGSSTVFGRYILEHGEQKPEYFQMTTYRFLIATIFLLIWVPLYPKAEGYPKLSAIFATDVIFSLLYLSIFVGLLSLILYYYGLKTTHASVSAIFELAYPVSFFVIIPILKIQWPETIQIIGALILITVATILSYSYGKMTYSYD